jgi:phage-related protein
MEYGKKTTTDSYFGGKVTHSQTSYSIPVVVKDRTQTLNEIMKAIALILEQKTHKVTVVINADKKYQPKMISVEYTEASKNDRVLTTTKKVV